MTKLFSFRVSHQDKKYEKLIAELEKSDNTAQLMKEILNDYFNGKFVTKDNTDLQKEKLEIDIRIKKATARIKEQEAIWWETFRAPPSYQAHRAILESNNESDNNFIDKKNCVFKCVKCNQVFRWGNVRDLSDKISYFVEHWYQNHHGDPPQEITEQLSQLSESYHK